MRVVVIACTRVDLFKYVQAKARHGIALEFERKKKKMTIIRRKESLQNERDIH